MKGVKVACKELRRIIVSLEYIKNQTLIDEMLGSTAVKGKNKQESVEEMLGADPEFNENLKKKKGDEADMLDWLYSLDYQKVTVIIVQHMKRYAHEKEVAECGVECWQEFARTAVDVKPIMTSGGCKTI